MAQDSIVCQSAPYPQALAELVAACSYRQGWHVWLTTEDYDRGQSEWSSITTVVDAPVPDVTFTMLNCSPWTTRQATAGSIDARSAEVPPNCTERSSDWAFRMTIRCFADHATWPRRTR